MSNVNGIIPAVITPMENEKEIDYDAFNSYIDWILKQGATGLAVNVDTGEGPNLIAEEKRNLLEAAKQRMGNKGILVAGIIGSSTQQVMTEAKMAKEAGVDIGLVFPNTAFRGHPQNPKTLKIFYQGISDYADIDLMLFILQDALGGIEYDEASLKAVASVERVIAVKEAAFDISGFKRTMNLFRSLEKEVGKKISFLTGNDNFIFESFLWGCDGALIGAAAQDTERIVECYNACVNGDWAEAVKLSYKLQQLVDAVFRKPVRDYRARTKACLYLQGVIPNKVVRPPLVEVPNSELEYWRKVLTNANLEVVR
jgi:4-hydroxy-tetrahydrodipicolinate synthase